MSVMIFAKIKGKKKKRVGYIYRFGILIIILQNKKKGGWVVEGKGGGCDEIEILSIHARAAIITYEQVVRRRGGRG